MPFDVGTILRDHDRVTTGVERLAEGNRLSTLRSNGKRGNHDIDLTGYQERYPVGSAHFDQVDRFTASQQFGRELSGQVDLKSHDLPLLVDKPKGWKIILDADH